MGVEMTPEHAEEVSRSPVRIHPQTLEFLTQVAAPFDSLKGVPESLSADSGEALAKRLILSYYSDYSLNSRSPKWRNVAKVKLAMAERYVSGEATEDIARDYPNHFPRSVEVLVFGIPTWLHKAERQQRIGLEPMFGLVRHTANNDLGTKWLEARDAHRQLLFGDEVGTPDDDTHTSIKPALSLAAIAIDKNLTGQYSKHDERKITEAVKVILAAHNDQTSNGGNGLFSFVNTRRDLDHVSTITAKVIWVWERAWRRHNKINAIADHTAPSPFSVLTEEFAEKPDFARNDIQLVVETSAAVSEMIHAGYPGSIAENERRSSRLSIFLAIHGPQYAIDWRSGAILREYCNQHGLDAQKWLSLISASWRVELAIRNPQAPLNSVVRLIENYSRLDVENIRSKTGLTEVAIMETLIRNPGVAPEAALERRANHLNALTVQQIAQNLGWSHREVKNLFGEASLREIARAYSNPMDKVRQVAKHYEQDLSVRSLMVNFDLSQKQAKTYFPPWRRKQLALKSADPLDAASVQLERLRALTRKYPQLPESIIANLSMRRPEAVSILADKILQEQANRPPGITETVWAWTVFCFPAEANAQRQKRVDKYITTKRLWRQAQLAQKTLSLDVGIENDANTAHERKRYDGDMKSEAATMLLPSDALDYLRDFAGQAGVAPDELQALLDHYEQSDDTVDDGDALLTATLNKLQQAASDKT